MYADLTFGNWLQRKRKALDLTQAELAQRVGYARVTIHKIETDEFRPSRQMAERLAGELTIALAERPAFLTVCAGGFPRQPLRDPATRSVLFRVVGRTRIRQCRLAQGDWQLAGGPLNQAALEQLRDSFDTLQLLDAVDAVDAIRYRLCEPDQVRDDLLNTA
jgi:transcriptional regulator with XRE-family HTH domain